MGKPDEGDRQWDTLVTLLRRAGRERSLTLDEAQQCFVAAPDEPLSAREIHALVAGCLVGGWTRLSRGVAMDFAFSTDTLVTEGDWVGDSWSGLSQWVALSPGTLPEDLVTDIDSFSVDTRRLRLSWAPGDLRLSGVGTDPIVFDVWTGLNALAALPSRGAREADVSWDVRLEAGDWDSLQCAVSSPTWHDFAGCSDEAVKGLRGD